MTSFWPSRVTITLAAVFLALPVGCGGSAGHPAGADVSRAKAYHSLAELSRTPMPSWRSW